MIWFVIQAIKRRKIVAHLLFFKGKGRLDIRMNSPLMNLYMKTTLRSVDKVENGIRER